MQAVFRVSSALPSIPLDLSLKIPKQFIPGQTRKDVSSFNKALSVKLLPDGSLKRVLWNLQSSIFDPLGTSKDAKVISPSCEIDTVWPNNVSINEAVRN